MKDFLEFILNQLVDHPDEVEVTENHNDNMTLLNVKLNKEDMGKVIGKEGKIIHAIRNLVKVLGIKEGTEVRVELLENA